MQLKIILSLTTVIVEIFGKMNSSDTINTTTKSEQVTEKSNNNITSKVSDLEWKFVTDIVPNKSQQKGQPSQDNTTIMNISEEDELINSTNATDNKLYFKDSSNFTSNSNSSSVNGTVDKLYFKDTPTNYKSSSNSSSSNITDNKLYFKDTPTNKSSNSSNTNATDSKLYFKDTQIDPKTSNSTNQTDGDTYEFRIYESRNGFLFQSPEIVNCPDGYGLGTTGACQKL